MKANHILFVAALALVANESYVVAQDIEHRDSIEAITSRGHDQLFPGKGKSNLFAFTGIPYALAGEYSFGITDGITISAMGGITASGSPGFGIRPRFVLGTIGDNGDIIARAITLYYPKTPDKEAWGLFWPQVDARTTVGSVMISAGVGVVNTACTEALFGGPHADHGTHGNGMPGHEHHEGMSAEEMHAMQDEVMWGAAATAQARIAAPIGERFMVQMDLYGIYTGQPLGGRGWDGPLPFVFQVGVSYALP